MTLTGNMLSAHRLYSVSMKSSRNSYLIKTQKYILRFFDFYNFFAFGFHPLSSAPSFYLLSSYPSFATSTPTNFIYLRIMVTTDWNYCAQLINSPICFTRYICLGFPASSLYNYICSTLSKSKFIFKPSTLSDSSKK